MPTLQTLPPELLLTILPHVPFTPTSYTTLLTLSPTFHDLLKTHESTLAPAIASTQNPPETLALFPDLKPSYANLLKIWSRLATLQDLQDTWAQVTNHGPDLGWMRTRFHSIHKTGTLLLYRLHDLATHDSRADLLNLLPAPSLACLSFKLYSSIKILRIYGPEPINATHAKGDFGARNEVELAFEEMLLEHGPGLFVGLLKGGRGQRRRDSGREVHERVERKAEGDAEGRAWAVDVLAAELSQMEERQLSPSSRPTLTSTLRRAFARKTHGGHVGQNTNAMWELLSGTLFDGFAEEEGDGAGVLMGKLVRGEEVGGGMRRMGLA